MDDTISRQAAIDALNIRVTIGRGDGKSVWLFASTIVNEYADIVKKRIEALPSSQPEIIRCKDCRWGRETCGNIECFVDTNIPPEYHGYDWYCPNGERRTDETDY